MTARTRQYLRGLLDQLGELHAELRELQASGRSPATQRLYADTLERCVRVHRLIAAAVSSALAL